MENNNDDDNDNDDNLPVFPLPRRRPHPPALPPGRHSLASAVVSGESGDSDDGDEEEDIFDDVDDIFVEETTINNNDDENDNNNNDKGGDDDDGPLYAQQPFDNDNDNYDGLYDKDLDEENEAYVYKYLRSGIREQVQVVTQQQQQQQEDNSNVTNNPNNGDATMTTTRKKNILAYKPRNTDAVLSCPCCFNIVCMDCQRHSKYANQYRAMFVMGITVDWYNLLVYDELKQQLHRKEPEEEDVVGLLDDDVVAADNNKGDNKGNGIPHYKEGEYFPVLCADCRTEVAALDMKEEIYHFHGCLESLG